MCCTYIHTFICTYVVARSCRLEKKKREPKKKSGLFGIHVSVLLRYFLASGGSFMRTKEDDKFKMSIATKRRCQEFKYRLCILNDVIFCAPHDIEQGFTNFPG